MRSPRSLPLALATIGLAIACNFDEVAVPQGEERPVVHAVLNPATSEQVVLLERTLTGRVNVPDPTDFTRLDPILSGGGVPISRAVVTVFGPNGDSVVAEEDRDVRPDGLGGGVYRFPSTAAVGLLIRPGQRYDLRIVTPTSDTISGSTTVPEVQVVPPDPILFVMNRDHDTLHLFWDDVGASARYLLAIDTPYGPVYLYTSQLEARVPGLMRNFLQERLPHAFLPGFLTTVWVFAVDVNYFDYFRSRNDPFTGSGLINRLRGGIGVFGSLGVIYAYAVSSTADFDLPLEGNYTLENPGGSSVSPRTLTLYVESPGTPQSVLTGRYGGDIGQGSGGFTGLLQGTDISLALLGSRVSVSDTVAEFTGTVHGDTLVGLVQRGATLESARFVKR